MEPVGRVRWRDWRPRTLAWMRDAATTVAKTGALNTASGRRPVRPKAGSATTGVGATAEIPKDDSGSYKHYTHKAG